MRVKYFTCFIVLLTFLSGASVFAQKHGHLTLQTEKVRELFDNDLFPAAEREIDRLITEYPDMSGLVRSELESYRVMCCILLNRPDIDGLVMEFEDNYPYAPELTRVKFYQSKFYFAIGDYSRSLQILDVIKNRTLPKDEKTEFVFNRAYCNMRMGKYDEASSGFEKMRSIGDARFFSSSTYYLAYIHYLNKDFTKSAPLFSELTEDGKYGALSQYYLLESELMLKDYTYVTENGDAVYGFVGDEYKGKVARIISEAYFEQDKKQEAKKYFEMYSNSGANLTNKDYYYNGIVSYSLGSYLTAIDAFSKVASQKDSIGQSSFFYIGNSYLNLKNKRAALDAYKSASGCSFDTTITSEASFQYAKLLFDLNGDITAFQAYLNNYPSTEKSDEIYYYIATSYLLSKNYKSAIAALNEIHTLTPSMEQNFQKASFFRAMQLFERGAYQSAITDYRISLKHGTPNPNLTLLTKFWLAEAFYRSNKFSESVASNLELVRNQQFKTFKEYPLSLYNLGYAYFRLYDFDNAIIWFNRYLSTSPTKHQLVTEAKTRLADSHFMLKNYEKAVELYSGIVSSGYAPDIYASYQGALCYGLLSQEDKKIDILRDIFEEQSDSPLYNMAVYELGRTYVQVEDTYNAEKCFNALVGSSRDSVYYSKSLLELGMIYSNKAQYDKAIGYFQKVVGVVPMSEDARSALVGLESIYQTMNKPDEYLAYIEQVGMSSIKSADEREMMLFNSAEQIFLSERYPEALESLRKFVEKYPDGAKTAHAYFYLGRTLLNMNKKESAAEAFKKVMEIGDGSFAELSTLYFARISYDLENYQAAISAYETLEEIAKLDNNKKEAVAGLMRAYYKNGDFEKAANKASSLGTQESEYIMAKSYLALDRRTDAIPVLKRLAKDSDTEEGAEAAFLLIQDAYDTGDFQSVANQVYALSDSKTSQSYWLAKSFIVLGDSFAEQEEWEQAKATFQSIVDGYEPVKKHDDILEQVAMRLKKLKTIKSE